MRLDVFLTPRATPKSHPKPLARTCFSSGSCGMGMCIFVKFAWPKLTSNHHAIILSIPFYTILIHFEPF